MNRRRVWGWNNLCLYTNVSGPWARMTSIRGKNTSVGHYSRKQSRKWNDEEGRK